MVVRRDGLRTRSDLDEWRRESVVTSTLKFGGVMEAVVVGVVGLAFWGLIIGAYSLIERGK